jgi:hypothetical protein
MRYVGFPLSHATKGLDKALIVNPHGIVANEPAMSEAADRVRVLRLGDNKALNGQRLRNGALNGQMVRVLEQSEKDRVGVYHRLRAEAEFFSDGHG